MQSGSKVKYMGYTQEDYDISDKLLKERPVASAIKGTFKVHYDYVVGAGTNIIYTRNVTCYCDKCKSNVSITTCEGYTLHNMVKSYTNIVDEPEVEPDCGTVEKEAWVAVLYASKWYIGHVREIDDDDVEVSVTFMTACGKYGNCFKWPTDKDELWVKPNDNIYVMPSTPQPSGKTGRIVRNPECELTKIEELSQN